MDWTMEDGMRAVKKMQHRTSCRNFEDRAIPDDLMGEILKTALQAASGGNLQPFSIIKFTEKEDNQKLMEACGNQKFIGQAAVNLVFCVDWHKMGIFARSEKAPFTCTNSYMHFLIAVEDAICAAQSVETAAYLCGIGACYVGTTNHVGDWMIDFCNLPKGTYPIVMLSLGYPKQQLPIREKLGYDMMVFDQKYPDMSDAVVIEKYRDKYGDAAMKLSTNEVYRKENLERFKRALLTSYTSEEAEEIIRKADAEGKINETQRRFGLHYHAAEMPELGKNIIKMMADNGLTPFTMD